MRNLTERDLDVLNEVAMGTVKARKLKDVTPQQENPFLFSLLVPVSNDQSNVVAAANEIFHGLGVLPKDLALAMNECGDYCALLADEDEGFYVLLFNHPKAMAFKEGDEGYEFTVKFRNEQQDAEDAAWEAEVRGLVDGIKKGRLKSKTPDGYLVLKGQFYDAIDSGKKTVEYRDFTEYNIKRTIGLKTIRFNRGYVKNAPQMKWEVKKIVLMDGEDQECDPFNVPEEFLPTTIALHLGKRID